MRFKVKEGYRVEDDFLYSSIVGAMTLREETGNTPDTRQLFARIYTLAKQIAETENKIVVFPVAKKTNHQIIIVVLDCFDVENVNEHPIAAIEVQLNDELFYDIEYFNSETK